MSLVDYASSSDDDEEENPQHLQQQQHQSHSQPSTSDQTGSLRCQLSSEVVGNSSMGSITALPNASELLESSGAVNQIGNDHSSRVAAAMAASASRKRAETNGSLVSMPNRKLPRHNLPPSRIPPDTSGSSLIPPQLRGRSNVVTEDIDKLFVRKRKTENQNNASSVIT